MATSNPTNDPKNATADEAAIQDLPASQDSTALTPDEEKNVMGGSSFNCSKSGIKNIATAAAPTTSSTNSPPTSLS
jgi:hypothetical protein